MVKKPYSSPFSLSSPFSIPLIIIFFGLFIFWALISKYDRPEYAYHLWTYYVMIGIGSVITFLIYGVLIIMDGFWAFIKNIWAILGIALVVWMLIGMVTFYIAWVSIKLTPAEIVTVEVLDQYYSGGRGGCLKWKVRFEDGSESTGFCTNESIKLTSPKTIAKARLTRSWLADEVYHLPLNIEK